MNQSSFKTMSNPLAAPGEVCALHYATREPVCVRWNRGRITAVERATEKPPQDLWIAPALVDLQINGFAGVDFQRDDIEVEGLLHAAQGLRSAGCTRWLFTLITDEWPKMIARLRHLRGLRAQSPELQHAIAGWHIEGPFLSSEPGFCGAHDSKLMLDPTLQHIRELRACVGGDPLLLTLAPDRAGALAAIREATTLGIRVSLGHTNATAYQLQEAVAAGARLFTHLGNACPRELDRFDNILWRVFETPGLTVSLIPDGAHVSPALFRLVHRMFGSNSVYYITDAMAAAGASPGRYPLGRLELEVGEDQVVHLPGSRQLAGSGLRPIDGVLRAAEMLGTEWQTVWPRFSELPARLMGLDSGLAVQTAAGFCLVQVDQKNRLRHLTICATDSSAQVQ